MSKTETIPTPTFHQQSLIDVDELKKKPPTDEEKKLLASEQPNLLTALEKGHPGAIGWLFSWRQSKLAKEAEAQAAKIQGEVAKFLKTSGEQGSLLTWCGFPTDLTRCSPFFPFNVKGLSDRKFLQDFVITSANWGQIYYAGPQLSTYEEDVLMALIAMLEQVSQNREVTEIDGRKTYSYKGPALPILRLLGYPRPGKEAYRRIIKSLELLVHAGLKLEVTTGHTKKGRKRAPRFVQIVSILSGVFWDEEKKELSATINPFFYEMYLSGRVTFMEISKRMSLKGPIAKALYRFVQSHRSNPVFTGHFLTLADALNMNRDQPSKKTRENLRRAIKELISQKVLTPKSGFLSQDIIKLSRTSETMPKKAKAKMSLTS